MSKKVSTFFSEMVENIEIKDAFHEDSSDGGFGLYLVFEKPYKPTIQRDEGICVIICDGVEFHKDYIIFIVNECDVLTVNWDSFHSITWKECPEDEYKEACKKYSPFSY